MDILPYRRRTGEIGYKSRLECFDNFFLWLIWSILISTGARRYGMRDGNKMYELKKIYIIFLFPIMG